MFHNSSNDKWSNSCGPGVIIELRELHRGQLSVLEVTHKEQVEQMKTKHGEQVQQLLVSHTLTPDSQIRHSECVNTYVNALASHFVQLFQSTTQTRVLLSKNYIRPNKCNNTLKKNWAMAKLQGICSYKCRPKCFSLDYKVTL